MILMLIKYQSLKKKHLVKVHLNTFLGIMIAVLLDHYIYLFHRRVSKKEINGKYNSFKYFIGYNDYDASRL